MPTMYHLGMGSLNHASQDPGGFSLWMRWQEQLNRAETGKHLETCLHVTQQPPQSPCLASVSMRVCNTEHEMASPEG